MQAILGKKIGMTQFLNPEGLFIPATVIEAGPCIVTEKKTVERHGYKAVQVGFGEISVKKMTNSIRKAFEKKKVQPRKWLSEIRLDANENFDVGNEIKVDIFKPGDLIDVRGTSIGKGFAGGVKRWHWRGGPETHGSMFHRRIGSAGSSAFPSRSWPGHRMPGHLGNAKRTIQNLEVLKVEIERSVLVVKGSVPGGDGGILFIRRSLKRPQGIQKKIEQKKMEKKKDAGKKKEDKPKK